MARPLFFLLYSDGKQKGSGELRIMFWPRILTPKNRCQLEAAEMILPPGVVIRATEGDIATGGGNKSHEK